MLNRLEAVVAGALIASRWLMAPIYLGLVVALLVVGVAFFVELIHGIASFDKIEGHSVILTVLKLVDLMLVGNLIMIMISGGIAALGNISPSIEGSKWAGFIGKVDFSGLKLKVVVSLVAICAIDLLESFMEIATINKTDLLWQIVILATFVVTGVLLAWMDRLAEPHE